MKITIEEGSDFRKRDPSGKTIVYEDDKSNWLDEDWDFLFQRLEAHQIELESKLTSCTNIGLKIDLESKIDRLHSLLLKYKEFIDLCEFWRHNKL